MAHATGDWTTGLLESAVLLRLASIQTTTLIVARARREDARLLLAQGTDPSTAKKAKRRAALQASETTFEVIAREWLHNQRKRLAPRYCVQILARLEADVFPQIGSRPIAEIDAPELLDVIRKVEQRGVLETALAWSGTSQTAWTCVRQIRPPGRGDFRILKIAHAPSDKNLSKNGSAQRG